MLSLVRTGALFSGGIYTSSRRLRPYAPILQAMQAGARSCVGARRLWHRQSSGLFRHYHAVSSNAGAGRDPCDFKAARTADLTGDASAVANSAFGHGGGGNQLLHVE